MNHFSTLPKEPEDPIYGLQVHFKKDERANKQNLSIGVLPGLSGKALRFSVLDEAETLLNLNRYGKDYLPIDGLSSFCDEVQKLLFDKMAHDTLKLYTAQTIGGTAALHIGAKLLVQFVAKKIFIPDPTWVNHKKLFMAASLEVGEYPYHATQEGDLDLQAILKAIDRMPEGSIILLQASCHNPTGLDPKEAEWHVLSRAIAQKKLVPFFDIAYQGLGGTFDEDAKALQIFFADGHEFLVASSFAKNLGLYSERVGALTFALPQEALPAVSSQVRKIIRSLYSSPSAYGAHIASTILANPELFDMWEKELESKRQGLKKKRLMLYDALKRRKKENLFPSLLKSHGLFCLSHLTHEEVERLRKEKGIYLCDDGRINIAALQDNEIEHIADAIANL